MNKHITIIYCLFKFLQQDWQVLFAMASSASNFCSVIDDQVCINFDHNIKVHFKLDDSIMVKDYDRNSSISVAGTIIPGMTRLFSINRSCINVHHNNSDCLVIEMSDGYNQAFNNK